MAGRGTGRGQGRPTVPQAIEAIKDALGIDPVSAMDWPVNVHGWNVSLNTFLLSETVAPCVYYGQWQCGGRELPIVVVVLTNVTPRPPLAIAAVCTLASDRSKIRPVSYWWFGHNELARRCHAYSSSTTGLYYRQPCFLKTIAEPELYCLNQGWQ